MLKPTLGSLGGPSVSVVLCTFNGATYLREQLTSLREQSVRPEQIVVSDDASVDHSVALLEAEAHAIARTVRLIRATENRGAVANFSSALALAEGDLVFLCDQDDRWHPDKVERLREALAAPGRLMVVSDARIIDRTGAATGEALSGRLGLGSAGRWSGSDWLLALLRRNRVAGATCAVRRDLLELALPIPDGFWHDEWLALVAAACDGLVWLGECLTDYRIHERNTAGLRGTGLRAVVTGAIAGGRAHHAAKAAKLQALADHLRLHGDRVSPARLQQVEAAVAFWCGRASLPASFARRAARVADMVKSHGYVRFGDGAKSALRDLLGV